MEPSHQTEEGTPFNMAMLYYLQIQKIMDKLTIALCDNDLQQARELTEELLTKAWFKLNKEERKELKAKSILIKRKFTIYSKTRMVHLPMQIKELMRDFNRDLLVKMDKYNMIFPKIEVSGGLSKLRKRYDLEQSNNNA